MHGGISGNRREDQSQHRVQGLSDLGHDHKYNRRNFRKQFKQSVGNSFNNRELDFATLNEK
jgi:hypothetical protein